MLEWLIGTAAAQDGGPPGAAGGGLQMIVMVALVFGIMYFLMIRPQDKKLRAHAAMVAALKKGDSVVTIGGLHGKVSAIEDKVAEIEVSKGVRVRVDKDKVARVESAPPAEPKENKAGTPQG
jgi:preprotein translocase subunit YajC